MAETTGEHIGNSNQQDQRKRLFNQLDHVISVSREKFDKEKALNGDRQKWARIIISAAEAYGRILETVGLEELEERVKKLEAKGLSEGNTHD